MGARKIFIRENLSTQRFISAKTWTWLHKVSVYLFPPPPFMTRTAFLFAVLALFAAPALAADAPVNYIAEMTGMVCAGCKDHVTASFTKLEGVSKVQIVPGDKPGTQKVTVTSTSPSLTKEQAVAALGPSASTYIVHAWKKSEQPVN
jgi:copper chaperone CopZ